MDGTDENEETSQKDIPKLPIKTYRWEDVRRSRKRGAYPWTHLSKPPFDEEADPEEYTMDAFRRSRSTSTIGKSETQEVSEVEEDIDMKENVGEHKEHNGMPEEKENIKPTKTEEPSTSKEAAKVTQVKPSQSSKDSRAKSEEPRRKRKLSIESSYSRISLSKQALMDKLKNAKSKLKVPKIPKRSKSDASDAKQTKKQKTTKATTATEESTKVPWLPPMSKESPVYIHIPLKPPPGETDEYSKLEFESPSHSHSGSLTNLPEIGKGRRKMSLMGILTEIKKVQEIQEQQKQVIEARRASQSSQGGIKQFIKLRPDLLSKKQTAEPSQDKLKAGVDHNEPTSEIEESGDSVTSEPKKLGIGKGRVQRKESDRLVIEEITDDDRKSNKSTEDSKPESERTQKPKTPEPIVVEPEDSSADDNISQYLDKEDKCEIVSEKSANISSESINQAGPSKVDDTTKEVKPETQRTPELSKPDTEKVKKLEVTLSKWKKTLPPISIPQASVEKQASAEKQAPPQRAKSEEPKRKRRSSIDSSYSRKSLSKLAFIKRLKEAKDKIKIPKFPSFTKADKTDSKKPKGKKPEEGKPQETLKKDKTQTLKIKQTETPVYIHIPLKLPPGQTDEFSHLADEPIEQIAKPEKIKEEKEEKEEKKEEESSVPTSPETPTHDIQLIILTPPSDDEILDSAGIPETPSESSQKSFDNFKIDELKTLAKNVVITICPESKKLETVKEDEGSDEQDIPEAQREKKVENMEQDLPGEQKTLAQKQQILVDEEDGLKLSDAAIAMINEELAKELKNQEQQELKSNVKSEGSPSTKKKVSFKRRSTGEDGERIYEDVELNKDSTSDSKEKKETQDKPGRLESFQSMSVDEEKSYLDKKVIKDTSLEDDYNKWSKLNDHEYEPVNPPPEEMTSRGPPPVRVADINHTAGKNIDGSTGSPERHFVRIPPDEELVVNGQNTPEENIDELGAQEVQRRIEDRFFNATPETVSSKTDGELHTSQADSSALETLPLKRESRKKVTAKTEGPAKSFNQTLRTQADKIKTKLQNIKKPNITLPQRPKFSSTKLKKPNFKKPSFKMPKMPERPSINLPSFNLTRKDSSKDSWRERQFSTESNAGDSKKKIFDFRTYPRIFDRAKKNKEASPSKDRAPTPPPPEFATVPRANRRKGPVGSRWANKFKDIKYADEDARRSKEYDDEETQDVIRIPLHPDNEVPMDVPSHTRYNEDIDIDDDFDRENRDIHHASPFNQDYLKRWNHGEFHEGPLPHELQYTQELNRGSYRITDLDNDMEDTQTPPEGSFDIGIPRPKEEHSSGSLSEHRQGVLEEIDSDEFFLREKGISQENIEVGKYLSSEIREAFRNPVNALSQLQSEDREYDLDASDQSEPLHDVPRKKPLKKPKRKKTPHTSKEKIGYDRESVTTEPEEYPKRFDEFQRFPPARPKRRSKKGKKKKPTPDDVIPYQETIPIEEQFRSLTPTNYASELMEGAEILPDNILGDNQQRYYENDLPQMYENEHMKGIEQPDIKVSDPYYRYENFQHDIDKLLKDQAPIAPTRRHRSLKSLEASEHDSIIDEILQQNVEVYRAEHEYIIPTPEPPSRPKRVRSRTQSQSGASQQEDDRTSRGAESLISDNQVEVIEEPCVLDIRDTSGYAVVDKSKAREPPLPPSRLPSTPPRARRTKNRDNKFATTPRSVSDTPPPIRPLRNYSTLGGPSRTSRSITPNDEEKENLDVSEYTEIDGEPVRRLQSGDVIRKMKDRPLPAPPRPPRRPRGSTREAFRDISHERNIPESQTGPEKVEETETETVTSGFISDEHHALLTDIESQILPYEHEETITHGALVVQPIDNAQILPYSQISNNSERKITGQPPVERTIPITREYPVDVPSSKYTQKIYDDEETSEIPEEFMKLKSPQTCKPTPPTESKVHQSPYQQQTTPQDTQEVGVLKAQKLQVLDLDVDKLRVNELQASKIIVSELEGVSLQVSEINSKSGNLVLSGIELPPHLIQEMLDRLQSAAHEQPPSVTDQSLSPQSSEATTQTVKPESISEQLASASDQTESAIQPDDKSAKIGQKKTPIEEEPLEISNFEEDAPPVPPRYDSKTDLLDENLGESKELDTEPQEAFSIPPQQECLEGIPIHPVLEGEIVETVTLEDPPVRPPRKYLQAEKASQNMEESDTSEIPVYSNIQSESIDPSQPSHSLEQPIVEELPVQSQLQLEISDSTPQADNISKSEEEPPPRPPQPVLQQDPDYIPSQPPPSFFALRSPQYGEFIEEDIPLPPRRKRHHKTAPTVSRSSSEDVAPTPRRHHRSPEPSIPQLTGQLVRACATEADRSLKRLISHITNNVLRNADGKQDLHVMILMLLILIAGLILLGGDEKITIHHHHWEFFNPPRDL